MQVFKKPNFKFMKLKMFAFAFSGLIILGGILNITMGKGLNYGIDFAGGTLIRLKFKDQVSISQIRQKLKEEGLGNSRIQEVGKTEKEYMIRTLGIAGPEGKKQDLEAHEIMGNKVIQALRPAQEKTALDQGKKDLNSIDEQELTLILQSSFPDEAQDFAHKIISYRISEGIISDYDQLSQKVGLKKKHF